MLHICAQMGLAKNTHIRKKISLASIKIIIIQNYKISLPDWPTIQTWPAIFFSIIVFSLGSWMPKRNNCKKLRISLKVTRGTNHMLSKNCDLHLKLVLDSFVGCSWILFFGHENKALSDAFSILFYLDNDQSSRDQKTKEAHKFLLSFKTDIEMENCYSWNDEMPDMIGM